MILLGKYRLLQKIGSGSFGSIYMCTEHLTQANMSTPTKTMQPRQYYGKLCRRRKAKATASSNTKSSSTKSSSPSAVQNQQHLGGVAKVYDYGVEDERLFMIIDLLGQSLEDLFQKWYVHAYIQWEKAGDRHCFEHWHSNNRQTRADTPERVCAPRHKGQQLHDRSKSKGLRKASAFLII